MQVTEKFMLPKLLIIFILVPLVELYFLIEIGKLIGTLSTIALIVFTGILGAFLARRQGLGVIYQIRYEMSNGRLPASQFVDGLIILLAGAVLLTPGIVTDILGFLCLIPYTRENIKKLLWRWFEKAVHQNRTHYTGFK